MAKYTSTKNDGDTGLEMRRSPNAMAPNASKAGGMAMRRQVGMARPKSTRGRVKTSMPVSKSGNC